MDTPQWPQGIGVMEGGGAGARKARPQKDQALNCPRCNSTNTKFCYYNNYSLSQPRYFCKTCRRYWTEGGSLRNVPVGGGSRKNKRSIPPPAAATAPSSKIKLVPDDHHDQHQHQHHVPLSYSHLVSSQNPSKIQYQGQDLNLSYPPGADHQHQGQYMSKFVVEMPQYMTDHHHDQNPSIATTTTATTPAMELFKSAGIASRGLISSFMSMPVSDPIYQNGLNHLQEFKPSGGSALNFSLDGLENGGYGTNSAKVLFPFEDSSRVQVSNTSDDHQGDSTGGYWTGMLGGEGGGGGGGGGSW